MKVNINSFIFKLVAAPLSCLYFDLIALYIILSRHICLKYGVPLILLNIVILWDIFTRRYSSKKDNFNRRVLAITFVVFPIAVALPYIECIVFDSRVISNVVFTIGCLAELVGGSFIIRARSSLGVYGTVNITIENDHQLVKEGLYKYVRNPMYDGFLVMLLGYCISLSGFLSATIVNSIVFMVLNKRVILEERLLEKQFGEEYKKYKEQTGRYLPKIVKKFSCKV